MLVTLSPSNLTASYQHPLEEYLLPLTFTTTYPTAKETQGFLHLIKVYINDFIQLAQCMDPNQLLHLSHAILHGIHSIFPLPTVTGSTEEDPITLKKLHQGDGLVWDTHKEILSWIFNGINCCIALPNDKHNCIQAELCTLC